MTGVALKMLFGDRAKLLGLVFGVAFATLLITQQSALFVGLMLRAQNVIADATEVDIWVMDPATEYVDLSRPMRDAALYQVRGVAGVAWAVPLFKASTPVRTPEGRIRNAMLLGVDDASLTGVTQRFLIGQPDDLKRPDAIAIDRAGYMQLWPGEPLRLRRTLELNDRRAVIAAITDAAPAFSAQVIIHTRYSQALTYLATGRTQLSFIQARAAEGFDPAVVAERIAAQTGLRAYTSDAFAQATIGYYLRKTGIPINFATTIALGLIVGAAVVGLTFHAFITDNLRQFAALKVIGLGNLRLTAMVLMQAAAAGVMGFAIGTGLAAAFFAFACTPTSALRGMFLPWWVSAGAGGIMALVILLATAASLKRVLVVDPALVLRS